MTLVIASGLGATFGFAPESPVGAVATPNAVNTWVPFLNSGLKGNKRVVESEALYGGLIPLASHRTIVGFDAKGAASFEIASRGMALFFQNMLGCVPVYTAGGSGVSNSFDYVLGNPVGMSMTVQVGMPDTGGNMHPFTYAGCKVVDWEISCATGQIAKLALTLDAMQELAGATTTAYGTAVPAYVAPSYLTPSSVMNFTSGILLLGSTAPAGIVKSVSIKGTFGLNVDRFQIGSTVKSEQLVDNWLQLKTTAEIEFANLTDLYSIYESDAEQQLVLSFASPPGVPDADLGGLNIVMAGTFADEGPPDVDGPALLTQKASFTSLNPSNGDSPLTLSYVSPDTSASGTGA